jgi:hypothetical protein
MGIWLATPVAPEKWQRTCGLVTNWTAQEVLRPWHVRLVAEATRVMGSIQPARPGALRLVCLGKPQAWRGPQVAGISPSMGSPGAGSALSSIGDPMKIPPIGLAIAIGITILPGCRPTAAEVPRGQRSLTWTGELTLKETDDVLMVTPQVSFDPTGGFLVAEPREAQVQRYSRGGDPLGHFGGKGEGPQEFRRPARAHRLPSSLVLVLDTSGKLAIADSSASRVLDSHRTPFVPLYDGIPLDDHRVVIAGRMEDEGQTNLVHVWDRTEQTNLTSFFPVPPHPERFAGTYAYAGYVSIAVRADSVAVLFALSDTVEIYSTAGALLKRVPVPFPGFRPLREPVPTGNDPVAMRRWQESTTMTSGLFWAADGTIIAQAYELVNGERRWMLASSRSDGTDAFQIRAVPKLLAVSPEDNTLVFTHRSSESPNQWSIASLTR